jgi:hypothetical protein
MERHEIEALRLAVLENGYTPIRNFDKRTFMAGWPRAVIDEAEVRSWSRRWSRHTATGLRIEKGLCVIDFDIDDDTAMAAITDAVLKEHPELEQALLRWGKGAKEAWFLRCDEIFARLHTRSFIKPGEVADDGTYRVEIFGGGSPRQFGAFGPHTLTEDGEVLVSYEWADDLSPATVPLAELVEVTKDVLWSVIDAAEAVLIDLGWTIHEKSARGQNEPGVVFDLTPDMLFECNDNVTRTLLEMRAIAKNEHVHLRCSASWIEGPSAKNRSRCLVSTTRTGRLAIWESQEAVTHKEKEDEPVNYGPMIDRAIEKLTELKEKRRLKVNSSDEFDVTVAKLIDGFAYCAAQRECVVPVWSRDLDDGYQMQAFRMLMLPNCMEEVGARGATKKINPVDAWMARKDRIKVDGLRMRPDMPRPLFEEDGKRFVNVYSPPTHNTEGGDMSVATGFFEHLIPDYAEREWFLDWLAFKMMYPHIPGPAVVMVAHAKFGTGRGTLAELIMRLVGQHYVRQLAFKDFTGKTYQSQYNEWQSEALFVCVNESSESDGASVYQTKHNTYEHLKEIVEVRPTLRYIRMKGTKNYWAVSSTSFLIFTNHFDALPIPEHDRRFVVLTNGGTQTPDYWKKLNQWLESETGVSCFYNWLLKRDIEGYSPFDPPPMFEAKAAMVDEAKSDLDRAMELSISNMPGEVFTLKQVAKYVKLIATKENLELPRPFDGVFRKVARRTLSRVGIRDGKNWQPMIGRDRHPIYAKGEGTAVTWTEASSDALKAEVLRNGEPDGSGSNVLAAFFDKHER